MALGLEVFIGGNVTQFRQAMQQAEQGLNNFQTTHQKTIGNIEKVAIPAAAAFAGLALAIGAATKAFMELEAVLNQVKAVSGATAAEMEALKQQALDLGAATVFSAREAAQAQAELAKSGMNVNQVLAATPGVLALAASDSMAVARAAEITAAALNGFSMQAEQAGYVADLLAKTANLSALSVEDVGESLKYASTIAASTSQSIQEVATDLAVMGNAGVKGSQGGTVFRAAIASLAKPSDDAAQKLHDLKIAVQDVNGKMLPLSDVIGQLREKTAGMTEVQRTNAVATIFGTEAMSGILAVMKQSPAEIEKVTAAFTNVTGAADEMSGVMNSGLKGSIEQLNGALDTAAATLGEQFAPAIMAVAKVVQGAVDAFNGLSPGMKSLVAGSLAAATALTGLVVVLAGVAAALPALTAGFGLLTASMGPIGWGIAALAVTVGIATVAFRNNAEASKVTAVSLQQQQDKVNALVAEYDQLRAKASLTADEKERLKKVIEEIARISPELVGGFNKMGEATELDRAAIERHNESAREQIRLIRERRREALATARAELAAITVRIKDESLREKSLLREKRALDLDEKGPLGFLTFLRRGGNEADLKMNARYIAELKKEQAERQAAVDKIEQEIAIDEYSKGASFNVPAAPPKRGAAVAPPGKKTTSSGAGAAAAAARAEFSLAQGLAEEQERFREAMAARAILKERGDVERKLSLLAYQKDQGIISETQYLQAVKGIRAEEIALDTAGKLSKIDADRKSTEAEIAAAKKAGTYKANEAQVLNAKLRTLDAQRLVAVEEANQRMLTLEQNTAQEITKIHKQEEQDRHDLLNSFKDKLVAWHTERIAAEKQAGDDILQTAHANFLADQALRIEKMEGLARERAEVEASYEAEIRAADKALQAAITDAMTRKGLSDETRAALIDEAGATRDLAAARAGLNRDKGHAEANGSWKKALQELQGDAVALATDPSMERIANFAKELLSDVSKVKEWSDAIKEGWAAAAGAAEGAADKLGAAIEAAGGGFEGFLSVVGGGASKLLELAGPLAIVGATVAALKFQFDIVTGAIAQVQKPAQALKDTLQGLRKALGDIEVAFAAGLVSAPEAATKRLEVLKDTLADLLEKQKELEKAAAGRNPLELMFNPFNWLGMGDALNRANIEQQIKDIRDRIKAATKPDLSDTEMADEGLFGIGIRQEAGLLSAEEALSARADLLKTTLEGLLAKQREAYKNGDYLGAEKFGAEAATIANMLKPLQLELVNTGAEAQKLADDIDRLNDLKDELAMGGRDSWGNRISLERERDLAIQNEMLALEEKKADAAKRQRDLYADIAKINEDERQAVADILNEGNAVRAESEAQSKNRRIEDVRAEARAKRDAKTDEIAAIEAQMAKEEEATAKAKSNIRILADERIAQLNTEITKQQDIVNKLQQQVDLQRQLAGGSASGGSAGGGSSYTSGGGGTIDGSKVAVGTTATSMFNGGSVVWDGFRWNRAATGGLVAGGVPGKDSVPMLTMPGELISSVPLTQGLEDMVKAYRAGAYPGASAPMRHMAQITNNHQAVLVDVGGLHVHAAPGMDVNGMVDQLWSGFSRKLSGSGLGKLQ
jgi:TP901 family phage tail tape measure protein